MIKSWDELKYWQTGEWQVIQERLDEMDKRKENYCPRRELLFSALDLCPLHTVRACIMGQDPYADRELATGLAFSIPKTVDKFPPTLSNIFDELVSDLGYTQRPTRGDLTPWTEQGVLLWNAVPSCTAGKPGSHNSWVEYDPLTKEIVETLSERGVVFGLLGSWAKEYLKFIDEEANEVIRTAHPSPRAANMTKTLSKFEGSRFFSTFNAKMREMNFTPIEWKLP